MIVDQTVAADSVQGSLFDDRAGTREKEDTVSRLMDQVNLGTGKNLLRVATQRPGHYADGIRREHCSQLYSTSWKELLEVR